jgi:ABC-type maltose transport system permease subunit
MEWLENTVIVAGLTSLMLLWVATAAGMAHVMWDTLGDHAINLMKRLRR